MKRALLAALLLTGCDLNIFGPDVCYVNRRPLVPVPDVYATWYAETEVCLGMRGDFASVRWFVADVCINNQGQLIFRCG